MKYNLKGIRFQTWIYFLTFSLTMLALLAFLMLAMIKPYFRQNRIDAVEMLANSFESRLLSDKTNQKDIEKFSLELMSNNACVLVVNQYGKSVYASDSLGQLCMLNDELDFLGNKIDLKEDASAFIELMADQKTLSYTVSSPLTGSQMLIYARFYRENLANYYLIINTPVELMESYIDVIMDQFFLICIFVLVIALLVSYLLASRISQPIIDMKKTATKLAKGDYQTDFKGDTFKEIAELAMTLNTAKDELSRVDELRKDLVANVSHDIKTPLTMIKAYAEMIKDISGDDPVKRNEHLDTILKETDYLSKLTSDMQLYSKMQAGYIELNRCNFDLKNCVEDVIDLLSNLIVKKNIELIKEINSVIIYGDELKISQVIYNYLSNAIKHTENGGCIAVRIIDSDDLVRFEVEDNGDGIDEKDLPYIWDRYYKIDKSFRRLENSTGLGLAIAKAILEAHHARFGASSKLNEGSLFYFELDKDYDNE